MGKTHSQNPDNQGRHGRNTRQFDNQPKHNGQIYKEYKPKITNWVQFGITPETIIFSDAFGKQLKIDKLTTTQIRNIFGELRRIQLNGYTNEKTSFLLLKPKLAYAAKRQGAVGLDNFYEFFTDAYNSVVIETNDEQANKRFENFMALMEAVLAYHKYYGGN